MAELGLRLVNLSDPRTHIPQLVLVAVRVNMAASHVQRRLHDAVNRRDALLRVHQAVQVVTLHAARLIEHTSQARPVVLWVP